MEKLPFELLELVIANADRSTLKPLRLTCKAFDTVTAPFLYHRLWISSHSLDLEVFGLVVSNPLLRKGVTELIWDDTTFCDSLMDRETYFRTTRAGVSTFGFTTKEEDSEVSEEGYQVFLKMSEAHHRIRKQKVDEQALIAALPLLGNLENVVLTNRSLRPMPDHSTAIGTSPTVRQWQAMPVVNDMFFLPYVNWSMVNGDNEDIILSAPDLRDIRNVDYHDDQWDEDFITFPEVARVRRPFRGLGILMGALARAEKITTGFTVRPQYWPGSDDNHNAGLSHWWLRAWHAGLDHMGSVFRNLTQLHLVLGCERAGKGRDTVRKGHLTQVLACLTRIEVLHLELIRYPVMDALGPDVLYTRLTEFTLIEGEVEPPKLFDFLNRHRQTLRSLELRHCHSRPWEWSELFYALQRERLCSSVTLQLPLLFAFGNNTFLVKLDRELRIRGARFGAFCLPLGGSHHICDLPRRSMDSKYRPQSPDLSSYAPQSPDLGGLRPQSPDLAGFAPPPNFPAFTQQRPQHRDRFGGAFGGNGLGGATVLNYSPTSIPQQQPVYTPQHRQPVMAPASRSKAQDEDDYMPDAPITKRPRREQQHPRAHASNGGPPRTQAGDATLGVQLKTSFPVARIKRIMQADEDVGKVAQVTPHVVSRALELFMIKLISASAIQARGGAQAIAGGGGKGPKRVLVQHVKKAIQADQTFDFLEQIITKVPDAPSKAKKEAAGSDSEEAKPARKRGKKRKDSADDG
ncbi:hypothetical protein LTR36_001744 [Oleoguttula mirabilis]|uniref:F-box domain-containing protein n=1 Tax=Oleoguttula mirabilis TaxID=1507867 RepID=A0AAV9JN60_9PEZI|nr:hypothetical protein LTR36_001744 [Oleoguttula mirabilis]